MALPAWLLKRRIPLLNAAAAGPTGTVVLNFVIQNRLIVGWWAQAVAASVNTFYAGTGNSKSQCQIANIVFSLATCCNVSPPAGCTAATSMTLCTQATGNYGSGTATVPTQTQIVNAINATQPVAVSLTYAGGAGYCAIYGYTMPATNAWIWYIADPVNGYSLMNSSIFPSQYFGGATWSYTVYTKG